MVVIICINHPFAQKKYSLQLYKYANLVMNAKLKKEILNLFSSLMKM